MRNYGLIEESPERTNIKYVVQKTRTKDFDDLFEWLCAEIKEKGRSTDRIIIYCQSRGQVSELYSIFQSALPQECHIYFNMYHTNTEDDIQRDIIKSFSKQDGEVRVLFATIAFGMGIDVSSVHTVIMVGHPTDLDDLMQLSGRAGRDGIQSVAVLLEYPGARAGVKATDEMKEFIRGEGCRREVIRRSFPSSDSHDVCILKHNCCDVCAKACLCEGEICSAKPLTAEEQLREVTIHGPSTSEYQVVSVSDSDVTRLSERLEEFRETLLSGTSCHLYTGGDFACGFSHNTMRDIVSECNIVFSYEQFSDRYLFLTKEIALSAWDIIQTTIDRQGDLPSGQNYRYFLDDTTPEDSEDDDFFTSEYAEIVLCSSDSD